MSDHTRAPHSVVGYVLVVLGMAIPGVTGLVAAINPGLGWITPSEAGGWILRTSVGGFALVLCAAAFGFVQFRKWSWWIAVVWGGLSLFEVIRFVVASSAIVAILFPQLLAVGLVVYAWSRRNDFGIHQGGVGA